MPSTCQRCREGKATLNHFLDECFHGKERLTSERHNDVVKVIEGSLLNCSNFARAIN
jgi:hypothetical protein